MMKRFLTATAMLATVTFFGCGEGQLIEDEQGSGVVRGNQLTWEEFNSMIYQEPGSDVYIVNGDEPIVGEKNLREFYDTHVATNGSLTVNRISGADDKWSATQKKNLTYCINKTKFSTRYNAVVSAMAAATAAWEAVADVKFVHVTAQDANCTASNSAVLFDVNPVDAGGQYIARAFFPAQSRSTRNVLIDNSAFTSSGDPSLTGVLRHELGHTLGFRHEHTRPEAGTCFEDNNYRTLTTYDQASVMHYPQCNGISSWALELTSKDAQGAQSLYGAPATGSEPTEPTEPTTPTTPNTTTETVSNISVAKGATKSFGPYAVTGGTTFEVVMTGSGDADLYVKLGSAPTSSSYTCRPYLDGSAETCTVAVPAGTTSAYVMVSGYLASTFSLKITYVKGTTSTPVEPPAPTVKTTTFSGSVAKAGTANHGPLTVVAGSTFKVVMSGSGDPDLYVNFGTAPTTSTYACRPYKSGAAETCTVTVPAGQTKAYLMVKGYTAATYKLDVTYTAP